MPSRILLLVYEVLFVEVSLGELSIVVLVVVGFYISLILDLV